MGENQLEEAVLRKVTRKFLPLLFVCFAVAFLDRVNVGFAALTMNRDLGLSSTAFGLGAGLFFLTYFLLEVPSNLALQRFGARLWIARIMLTWGLLSGAMAFVQNETSFYILRLLLGAAEAGFFPGVIFFLSLWVPVARRAAVIAGFALGNPLASVVGSPLSGLLLQLDGAAGLRGWQWMFLIEALPAIVLAFVVLRTLRDRPEDAEWLSPEERDWLSARLAADDKAVPAHSNHASLLQIIRNPLTILLSVAYFGVAASIYGLAFFMPQIVNAFGLSILETGFVSAIPFVAAGIGMIWWGRRSDNRHERRFHVSVALGLAVAGLVLSTLVAAPIAKLVLISIAAFGANAAVTIFWAIYGALMPRASAAAGIAFVNSIGNLSGFVGPYLIGAINDSTGSFSGGLQVISLFGLIGFCILLAVTPAGAGRSSVPLAAENVPR